MIKITEYAPIKSSSGPRKKGSAAAAGFSDLLDASASASSEIAATADIVPTAGISHLLAFQEISDDEVARKKQLQHGNNTLESLDKLRRQLLMGEVPIQTLRDLERQLAQQKQQSNDPALNALIDDIELRAAVELAKLEMAAQASARP